MDKAAAPREYGLGAREWAIPRSMGKKHVWFLYHASTQLRAWSILDCPYSPLDFNPLDMVWLDTTKAEIEIGDGLPDIRLTSKCLEALKQAGFEVIWEKDLAIDSPVPWYLPLDKNHLSLSSFRLTAMGRFFTRNMVKALEFVGFAPKGSQRVQDFLEKAAEGLVEGGTKEIFTPMYFFLARKPLSDSQ